MSSALPDEIRSLVVRHVDGFNKQNTEQFASVFADSAVIIDGIAPYRWLAPNAPANWLADVEKWREAFGVTHERLDYEVGFYAVEGSYGYAVLSASLSLTMKGQDFIRTGTLAYTFAKYGESWKIDAQAWGRTS